MCPSICYNKINLPQAPTLPLAYSPLSVHRPQHDHQSIATGLSFAKGVITAGPFLSCSHRSDLCVAQARVYGPDGASFVKCDCCGESELALNYYYGLKKCSKGGKFP